MRAACIVALSLAACCHGAAVTRDVPKGHCHNCEVTCFEDCIMKFDREIIQPDLSGKDRLSRKDSRVEAHMKKKMHGVVLSQNASAGALKDSYGECLAQEKCPCSHQAEEESASFLQAAKKKKKCQIVERPCAIGCFNKTIEASPALLQANVSPGPKNHDDAAMPWSVNIHPVKINTFATGRQNLEQCHKSCLAATCGCDDAPGMESIDDLGSAIKKNDAAKDPVEDTQPSWHYKPAVNDDCGKGMQGKKVTTGLYADLAGGPEGWVEVCSDQFFEAAGNPGGVGQLLCSKPRALLAGCVWDQVKESCVYGMKPTIHCYTRYKDDDKF